MDDVLDTGIDVQCTRNCFGANWREGPSRRSQKQNGPPELGVRYPPMLGYGARFVGFAELQKPRFLPFLIPVSTPSSGGPIYILGRGRPRARGEPH